MATVHPTIVLPPSRLLCPRATVPQAIARPQRGRRRTPSAAKGSPGAEVLGRAESGIPLLVAALLVGLAFVVAPEQPQAQEAICHRHSGVVACRVW